MYHRAPLPSPPPSLSSLLFVSNLRDGLTAGSINLLFTFCARNRSRIILTVDCISARGGDDSVKVLFRWRVPDGNSVFRFR